MSPTRGGRQHGGLALRLALVGTLAVLVTCGGVGYVRLTAVPDLGPPPRGPAAGASQIQIAASMATTLVRGLLTSSHATVTLSEQDLTVLVRAHNPDPQSFHDPEARVRAGLLVVSAATNLGPVAVTAVGRLALSVVSGDGGGPDIAADVREVDAGEVSLPARVRDSITERIEGSVSLRSVLASDATLSHLRPYLDCVAVLSDGVRLGFHRPTAAAEPSACA